MKPNRRLILTLLAAGLLLSACYLDSPRTLGTPMPTIIPATPAQFASLVIPPTPAGKSLCQVYAVDLLGAWATANAPESDPFPFTDVDGQTCQASFEADIQPLFTTPNLWYSGAPACNTCHYADVKLAWAQLDLSSYAGILAGSRRTGPEAKGNNILGLSAAGVNWGQAILYTQLTTLRMPPGRPPSANDPRGPLVSAGSR